MISIYKITCETGKVYYGSTKNINKRFSRHKSKYKDCSNKDFLNPKIQVLETCNEEERIDKESYYIRNFECVNKIIPNRTKKEYTKTYNKNNCEKIKFNNDKRNYQDKYTCECGSIMRRDTIKRHERTKKHLDFKKTINSQ